MDSSTEWTGSRESLIHQWTKEGLTQTQIEEKIFDIEEKKLRQQERKDLGLSGKTQNKDFVENEELDDIPKELETKISKTHLSKQERKEKHEKKEAHRLHKEEKRKRKQEKLQMEAEKQARELKSFKEYEEEDGDEMGNEIAQQPTKIDSTITNEDEPEIPWLIEEDSEDDACFDDEEELKLRRPITLEKLHRIQITRRLIEQFVGQPFFNELVTGCFVRLWIGNNQVNEPVYRLCRVSGFEKKPTLKYKVGARFTQDLMIVNFGKNIKSWRMDRISNAPVTAEEFNRWIRQLQEDDIPMVTIRDYQNRKEAFDRALNWTYTEDEITEMVEQRQRLQPDEFLNLAQQRSRLRFRLDVLLAKGLQGTPEYEEAENKFKLLVELEDQRLIAKVKPWERLVLQTARNRQDNIAIQYQRFFNTDKKQSKVPESQTTDVYARIPTQPQIYWWTGSGGESEEQMQRVKHKEDDLVVKKEKNRLTHADAAELLSDVHGTILLDELEIDEIVAGVRPRNVSTKIPRCVPTIPSATAISLRDYKKLKTA